MRTMRQETFVQISEGLKMESKYEMNMDEMEERIGRKIGCFEKVIFIKTVSGKMTEWHFLLNVWRNITPV